MPQSQKRNSFWKQVEAERVGVLVDGENFFLAFYEILNAAEQHIVLLGWDFDTRGPLVYRNGRPVTVAQALWLALETRPSLRIFVLCWDYAAVYMFDREFFPDARLRGKFKNRLFLEFDGHHPSGASHHQKIIVADGAIAFSGGMDLGVRRWDTRDHLYLDPRRINLKGEPYLPYHDVQAVLTGEVVSAMSEIVQRRWERATGSTLSLPVCNEGLWPPSAPVHFKNIQVQISRTMPPYLGEKNVDEIELQFLKLIATARECLYIENQYFSSEKLANAIAARLMEERGPEIIMMMPLRYSGWFESRSVGAIQATFVGRLRALAKPGKFCALSPITGHPPASQHIHVHAKVVVRDDSAFVVGSANFNNRSLGLDSECNLLFLPGEGNAENRVAILRQRNALLAEHLGCSVDEFELALARHASVIAALNSIEPRNKSVVPALEVPGRFSNLVKPIAVFFDPSSPMPLEVASHALMPGRFRHRIFHSWAILLIALLVTGTLLFGLGMLGVWNTFFSSFFSNLALSIPSDVDFVQGARLLVFILSAVLALFLFVPFHLVVFAVAWFFSFWQTIGIVLFSGMVVALLCYFAGAQIGKERVFNLFSPRLGKLRHKKILRSFGVFTVAWLRIMPVAPFSVLSMATGACGVSFLSFFWGTFLGMLPAVFLITQFVQLVSQLLGNPTVQNGFSFGLFLSFLALLAWFVLLRSSKRMFPLPESKNGKF